ncbi:MAG: DUF1549 and DUF1553 domain-containing protein [Gemmataceae bacterium]|nr:DUF1549 and DUF1553 domain-containing protein [Gemmata sp.]MDW8197541.1 DUF1549 and DUF1553 domain-containing protein [Gemmataceae bacterium]
MYRLAWVVGVIVAWLGLPLLVFAADADNHWAWRKPQRPPVPQLPENPRANPIDAFIRAKLAAAQLSPAPRASREQLLRRVTFDLTGLPPTPEEIDAFVHDHTPDAWAKVVDRLLASPRYGERWGRHWLDLARYADTNGYEFDEPRPDAWRYRDYVIRSFNADKPFDRLILEHIAGDEAFPDDPDARIATGFHLLGPDMTDSSDQAQRRYNTLSDMTDTTALVFLGLTLTCARCHDHKFEPLTQLDYFRFFAFFTPAVFRRDLSVATADEVRQFQRQQEIYWDLTKTVRAAIDAIEEPHRQRLFEAKLAKLPPDAQAAHRTPPAKRTPGQLELVAETERKVQVSEAEIAKALSPAEKSRLEELKNQLQAFDAQKPTPLPTAMGLMEASNQPPKTYLLERGELANQREEVEPGFPAILLPGQKAKPAVITPLASSSGRRLALAQWLASPENPLTARVIVNRLWQHHFGRGIVATPNDFGTRGAAPSHPELLDWLACELIEQRWSLKAMHRLMVLSETYQQSSFATAEAQERDPKNTLFSRMNRRRLEAEAVRDALLAISGQLNLKMGGPGVVLPSQARAAGGARALTVTSDPREHTRRSVYLFCRRNLRDPFLEAFDFPDTNLSCPQRERSTTAPQALALLNAPEAVTAAQALAQRLKKEAPTREEQITLAYRLTLGRKPTAKEIERAIAFLNDSPLSEFCRALLNLNEFLYVD